MDYDSTASSNVPENEIDFIDNLIANNSWARLQEYFEARPEAARGFHPPHHTRLHWLSSIGSAPLALIDLVARIDPAAITLPDDRYGDTCLHLVARNCQTSAAKLKCLLGHLTSDQRQDILIRNVLGGTALHSAVNHNAVLEALQVLVERCPEIIRVTTLEGTHAVSALWSAFTQTIPGYMLVARILNESEQIDDPFFQRFWDKAEFLALQQLRLVAPVGDADAKERGATDSNPHDLVLHGLLRCNVAINFFKVALKRNRASARAADAHGDLSFHRLLEDRPYRLKERDAILAVLAAAPEVATILNRGNESALLIAIRNRIPWENGVDAVARESRHIITHRDMSTRLLPFQFAAYIGGRTAIATTFQLLLMRPDLLTC